MRLDQTMMPLRAFWYLRIARNTTPPSDVRDYLLERIDRQRQDVICKGAAAGQTISTEAALKHVLDLKINYDGPDREEYVSKIDSFANEFRKKRGPLIPVDQAHAILKELEARFGRGE
jgi:hypothetical protein